MALAASPPALARVPPSRATSSLIRPSGGRIRLPETGDLKSDLAMSGTLAVELGAQEVVIIIEAPVPSPIRGRTGPPRSSRADAAAQGAAKAPDRPQGLSGASLAGSGLR